jgi:putative ABC transport system permease protein
VLRVAASEFIHRRARTLALLLGILVATTSFTVLTGTSESQRLEVRGTVARNFRGDYDVLVRPRGARTAPERRVGDVQPGFASGQFGGIHLAQWRAIERIPGIEVGAPIANLGYVVGTAVVRVPLSRRATAGPGRVLLRVDATWRADRGLTRIPEPPSFVYVTPDRLSRAPGPGSSQIGTYANLSLREHVPHRARPALVCTSDLHSDEMQLDGPFAWRMRSQLGCFSRRSGNGRIGVAPLAAGRPRSELRWSIPLLLTAVDPSQEARLTGLGRALVSGRGLREADRVHPSGPLGGFRIPLMPVLASARPPIDEQADVSVRRLPPSAARGMLVKRWSQDDSLQGLRWLRGRRPGAVVQRTRLTAADAYSQLLRQLRGSHHGALTDLLADPLWSVGPTAYTRRAGVLEPRTRPRDDLAWNAASGGGPSGLAYAPATARERPFRVLSTAANSGAASGLSAEAPVLEAVGTFDPARLDVPSGPGAAPPTVFEPPLLQARGAAARRALGGRPLLPDGDPAGYLAQPPALLTTLRAARVFDQASYPDLWNRAPISAIRVRVAGVTGPDPLSRERIREAAERIATRTGLDVDITAGASGAPTAIELPAGRFGRPALALTELWVRKGVAARVLTAVDRKSVVLFVLILVVCALFVTNAAGAAVRARRVELGVLASLGWSTSRLFGVILAEVGAVGLVAGVLGGFLALPLAALVGVGASVTRALVAIPAATLLALLAGLVPAARAARADPAAAVRPAVLEVRRARQPRGPGTLALVNLLRTPGRTALGAASLAIGVGALTLLLAATVAFHEVLVGTLLGQAVAVQVRATDYAAVVATILLGAGAVADVLFLNLRDRAGELATLGACGWDDRALSRLVALEGVWTGAAGALAGAGIGLAAAAVFAGTLPAELVATSAAAGAVGVALAALGSLAPAAWLRRMPVVELLAEE